MKRLFFLISLLFSLHLAANFEPYFKDIEVLQQFLENEKFAKADSMATVLFEKMDKDSIELRAKLLFSVGKDCYYRGFIEKAEYYFLKSVQYQKESKFEGLLVDTYLELGSLYYYQQKISLALKYFKSSLEMAIKQKDRFGIGLSYNNIGLIFMYTNSYYEAQKYFEKTLEYLEGEQFQLKGAVYTNLGVIQYYRENYTSSLNYLEEAENVIQSNPEYLDQFALANVFLNKALSLYEFREFKKAISYLEKAMHYYQEEKKPERVLLAEINLMINYYFSGNPSWERLASGIKDSVLEADNSDLKYDFFNYLSLIYKDLKDYEKAFEAMKKANEWLQIRSDEKMDQALQSLQGDVTYKSLTHEIKELSNEQATLIDEKKQTLAEKEELQKRNRWILILSTASVLFLIGLIIIFYRSSRVQRKLNLQLETQNKLIQEKHEALINSSDYAIHMEKMLLQQMNPHFIFNALMTIEASLNMKEYDFALKYLEQFTQLVRKTLDNSRAEVIPLEDEIDYLKSYISLYQTKLGQVFEYHFSYNEELVEDFVYTPPMLVQPFIENAILHGLMNKKEGPKYLEIEIEPLENTILWKIKDNGIGRKASARQNAQKNVSHGSKITEDRIKWMANIYGSSFSIDYTDLEPGTLVTITTPIIEK